MTRFRALVLLGLGSLAALLAAASVLAAREGSPDRSFGGDGRVLTRLPPTPDYLPRVGATIDGAGRIVAFASNSGKFLVLRYLPDGSLDASFGQDGKVVTAFGFAADPSDVAVDSQGRVVATGSGIAPTEEFNSTPGTCCVNYTVLARYLPDGSLDPSFSADGLAVGPVGTATSLTIDSSDRAVVTAIQVFPQSQQCRGSVIVRFSSDGSEDVAFNTNTRAETLNSCAPPSLLDVTIDVAGRIVAAGATYSGYDDPNPSRPVVWRLMSDGRPDLGFGGDGEATLPVRRFSTLATGIALDGAERILLSAGGGFAAARLNPDGSPDRSFSADGKFRLPARERRWGIDESTSAGITVDERDRPILAGSTRRRDYRLVRSPRSWFGFLRLTPGGKPDRRFGRRGLRLGFGAPVCKRLPCPPSRRRSVSGGPPLLYPGKRLVSVGRAHRGSRYYLALARIHLP